MSEQADKLREMEYRVEISTKLEIEGGPVNVYFVEGFDMSSYVREDDEAAWEAIIDSHDERVLRSQETHEETMERIARTSETQ